MPQSDATRPPEPSSPPARGPNASPIPLAAADDAPASDSEAETERLHDSPVKKRGSLDVYEPAGSAKKRARHADDDPALRDAGAPEHVAANGVRRASADDNADGSLPHPHAAHAARAARATRDSAAREPETETPEPAVPEAALGVGVPAAVEPAVEPAAAMPPVVLPPALDPPVSRNGGTELDEDEAEDAEGGDVDEDDDDEDDDDGNDGDEDDEDDENGDDEAGDDDEDENDEGRMQAISALTEIEIEFAEFRDKLHDQQIARFDLEIQMCTKGVHPELEQYHEQIREEREKRLLRSRSLLAYQMRAICNQSHAGRCQVHQTHLKSCHSLRGELMTRVSRDWYRLNHERRAADSITPTYGYVAQSRPHQIRRPTVRSMGIRFHTDVPLPAAPPMICANEDERDEDLRQLGLR